MFKRVTVASSFSTAPTPPLCESPRDGTDSSYEAYVIRLSVHKLENKKHSSKLRNATLIRSVHQRALQFSLSSSLSWDRDPQPSDELISGDSEPSHFSLNLDTEDLDGNVTSGNTPSVWDMIDAWEESRKRGEGAIMDDADDIPKRVCLGIDGFEEDMSFDWGSPITMDV